MNMFTRLALCIAAGATLMLSGCGKDGQNGQNGRDGKDAASAPVTVAGLTAEQWEDLALTATVEGVTINSPPVVKFRIVDGSGAPVVGLGTNKNATTGALSNVSFALAKLVPGTNGSPSKWVSYIVTTVDASNKVNGATRPTTDNTGTLVDNGDGSYTYTFARDITKAKADIAGLTLTAPSVAADLGDLTYDSTLTHRLTIQISGSNAGATLKNPLNIVYDFVPSTGKKVNASDREIVLIAQCNECHSKLAIHGGGRVDARYCVVCHTDQRKFGYAEATTDSTGYTNNARKVNGFALGDFPNMIHKYHMGHHLSKTYKGSGASAPTYNFTEVGYPQDVRNCVKCHTKSDNTPQGDNWNTVPSALACGACHDGVNFKTGAGHIGGSQPTDAICVLCHNPQQVKDYHARTGSSLTFEITDFTINSSNKAVVKFKFNLDGKTQFDTYSASASTVPRYSYNNTTHKCEPPTGGATLPIIVTGYVPPSPNGEDTRACGAYPSIRVDFATSQDGVTNPDDFNNNVSVNLDVLWAQTSGNTLSYDSATGVYTATLGTALALPASGTKMATAKIVGYGSFAKASDGKRIEFQNVSKAATSTGFTARRTIVSNDACNKCHEKLGNSPNFHSGMRNDAPTCAGCHHPNLTNSGWSVNASTFIHAIHGRDKRSIHYRWEDIDWTELTYPGVLNKCEQCHIAGGYDFSITANKNAAEGGRLLYSTAAAGTIAVTNINRPQDGSGNTIYIATGTDYGAAAGNTYSTANVAATQTHLVHSPITAACFSCHDSASATAHMKQNGGSIYAVRSTAITTAETCLVCHGSGKVGDIKVVHSR